MNLRSFLVELGDSFYYNAIGKELTGMRSVLDLGCGSNSPLAKVKKNYRSTGVDVFEPSVRKSRRAKIHNNYKVIDLLKADKVFKGKSFDAVVALDVIEHFDKKDGEKLLTTMENLAKKKVIVFTPYGFTKQHLYDGNPFQVHKSGWFPNEFKKRGYEVYGMRGFRFIRGEFATIRYRPWFFWGLISTLSQLFVYKNPKMAYQLFAVKTF